MENFDQMYSYLLASNPGNFLSPAYHLPNTFRTNPHKVPSFFSSAQCSFQPACDNRRFNGPPCCNTLNARHETRIFDFRSLLHSLFSFPNWQRHTTKASEKFNPLSLYYFGVFSVSDHNTLQEIASPRLLNSFPDLVLADRARIKNSKWPPQT